MGLCYDTVWFHPITRSEALILMNTEKMDELRNSAETLAKQAAETAELGLKLVKEQFESFASQTPDGPLNNIHNNMQNTAVNMEVKAKEMFTMATNFLTEINEKWQPSVKSETDEAEAPKAEKITINVD
jgi:hypothetical protein